MPRFMPQLGQACLLPPPTALSLLARLMLLPAFFAFVVPPSDMASVEYDYHCHVRHVPFAGFEPHCPQAACSS